MPFPVQATNKGLVLHQCMIVQEIVNLVKKNSNHVTHKLAFIYNILNFKFRNIKDRGYIDFSYFKPLRFIFDHFLPLRSSVVNKIKRWNLQNSKAIQDRFFFFFFLEKLFAKRSHNLSQTTEEAKALCYLLYHTTAETQERMPEAGI